MNGAFTHLIDIVLLCLFLSYDAGRGVQNILSGINSSEASRKSSLHEFNKFHSAYAQYGCHEEFVLQLS